MSHIIKVNDNTNPLITAALSNWHEMSLDKFPSLITQSENQSRINVSRDKMKHKCCGYTLIAKGLTCPHL